MNSLDLDIQRNLGPYLQSDLPFLNILEIDQEERYYKFERDPKSTTDRHVYEFFLDPDNKPNSLRVRKWLEDKSVGAIMVETRGDLAASVHVIRPIDLSFSFVQPIEEPRSLLAAKALTTVNFTLAGELKEVGIYSSISPEESGHILFSKNGVNWIYQFGNYPGDMNLGLNPDWISKEVKSGETIISAEEDFSYKVIEIPEVGHFRFVATELSNGKQVIITAAERVSMGYWLGLIDSESKSWRQFMKHIPVNLAINWPQVNNRNQV